MIGSRKGLHLVQAHIHPHTWVEVNLQAIRYNIQQMMNILSNKTKIMAVVKANAYGHGMIEVAETALTSGAEALAVARLEEALQLRKAKIKAPILVLGVTFPEDAHIAAENNITLTVFQKEWIQQVEKMTFQRPLNIHLKWDTGMGRIGIRDEETLSSMLKSLRNHKQLHLTGAYTHFATADEVDLTFYLKQKKHFQEWLHLVKQIWPTPLHFHTGNSAAAIRFPKEMQQYIRYGIAMYGLQPSKVVAEEKLISLKSAFSLHSRLIHVKKIESGDSISYGRTYQAKETEWVGTIPVGYGDGWSRRFQGASVLIQGKKHPIIGRICMDQMMVKLDQPYPLGEKVTLIGRQQNESIDLTTLADHIGTIHYEIPCMINQRIPRTYIR